MKFNKMFVVFHHKVSYEELCCGANAYLTSFSSLFFVVVANKQNKTLCLLIQIYLESSTRACQLLSACYFLFNYLLVVSVLLLLSHSSLYKKMKK